MLSRILAVGIFLLTAFSAWADEADHTAIRNSLTSAIPGLQIKAIGESPIPGLYEVEAGDGSILYTSADGKNFVAGEFYRIEKGELENVTETRRQYQRAELIASVPETEMVVFKPEEPKATITVFTDVDCGYCRKLHREVTRLNELGIQVNYLAFPRAGIGSSSYKKIVSAWCADDPKDSITRAKNGQSLPERNCENPVANHLRLGEQVGVRGTPAIVLENGRLIPGYLPAESLAQGLGIPAS